MRYIKLDCSAVWLFAGFLLGAVGCTQEEPPLEPPKIIRPVKVMVIPSITSFMETKVFSGVAESIEKITVGSGEAATLDHTYPAG